MGKPEEVLDPNKTYSTQEVKDMLAAQKVEHEQETTERMTKHMESKFVEMFDKRLPAGAIVVSSPRKLPAPGMRILLEALLRETHPSRILLLLRMQPRTLTLQPMFPCLI